MQIHVFLISLSFLMISIQIANGQIDVGSDLTGLREEINQITIEIQKSNANAETLFWTAIIIGEIIAGIAVIATVVYAQQLKSQNKIIQESFDATKVKHMVDSIHEIEVEFDKPEMVNVAREIAGFKPVIVPLGGKLPELSLRDYLLKLGKIYMLYEVGMFTIEYIHKIFGARILPVKYNKYVQKYLKDIRKVQGEQVFKQIDYLTDLIEEYAKIVDPNSPLLKAKPLKTLKPNDQTVQKPHGTLPKGFEPKSN